MFQSGHMATNDPCLFLPRSSLGTSDTSSLILLKIISKRARGVQSTHPEAFNYEETRRSVRWWWCRRRCASPGYMLLSSRGVRTMYPRLCARISFRFEQVQGLYAGKKKSRKIKPARVSSKPCCNPADSALREHGKTRRSLTSSLAVALP